MKYAWTKSLIYGGSIERSKDRSGDAKKLRNERSGYRVRVPLSHTYHELVTNNHDNLMKDVTVAA